MTFPDPAALLRELLEPVVGAGRVYGVRPASLTGRLPLVEAYRFGGGSTATEDFPLCAVNVLADARVRGDGLPLAERCRDRLLAYADVDTGLVRALHGVEVRTGPVEQEYPGDGVRMWAMTVALTTHDVEWITP